jgi:GNAT superfamily N-acetyltransferase
MPDSLLDDPEFIPRRERMWTRILAGELFPDAHVAVALRGERLIGIALAGKPEDQSSTWSTQLFILYVCAAEHGSGAGPALFKAVIEEGDPALLWVADPNPRAQAFYRKRGFRPDGVSMEEDGVREIRMVRAAST